MFRIGQSTDIHPLKEGRKLIIGGVNIPYEYGLDGHSDADVLLHAISEAILGALGLNDLGCLFPDTDKKYKDISSLILLKEVYEALVEKGYNPINQIVGYILSGDPTYITSHNDARNLIRKIERDELLEKIVQYYIGLED